MIYVIIFEAHRQVTDRSPTVSVTWQNLTKIVDKIVFFFWQKYKALTMRHILASIHKYLQVLLLVNLYLSSQK